MVDDLTGVGIVDDDLERIFGTNVTSYSARG